MTIAGVYLTSEGVVIGADSTSSNPCEGGMHFFDFNQKVFEIGEGSTVGMLTWGLGSFQEVSYRTLLAQMDDRLKTTPAASLADLMQMWLDIVWNAYINYSLFKHVQSLHALTKFDANVPYVATMRTEEQEKEFNNLVNALGVGFCIAGYVEADRKPQYAFVFLEPLSPKPQFTLVSEVNSQQWFGVPNVIDRLIVGADSNLVNAILKSGHWKGTDQDLVNVIQSQRFYHASLPIRDAIDYVHSCISSTIKAMKFSNFSQVCGGPIEIAVITTDRKFRWVRHKSWDAAIIDGGL